MQRNNYTHAIADLSRFLKLHPRVASAHQLRGIAYRENGDTEKAAADFKQAETLTAEKQPPIKASPPKASPNLKPRQSSNSPMTTLTASSETTNIPRGAAR